MAEQKEENAPLINENTDKPQGIPNTETLKCCIQWDKFEDSKTSDIDISAIILDQYSFELGVVYFNQTSFNNNAITHSGDNKTGTGDGDDEYITIKLSLLPNNCLSIFILVNMHTTNSTFSDAETANFIIKSDKINNIDTTLLGTLGNSTGICVGVIYRKTINDNIWFYKTINNVGNGHNFNESSKLYIDKLSYIYQDWVLADRPNDRDIVYNLEKGGGYVIDNNIKYIKVGLGWDPDENGGSIDVDASAILLDNKLDKIDVVYYGNLKYQNVVMHSGDNLTGSGSGDDEQITLNLKKMNPHKIGSIILLVNIFSGSSSFKNIKNCYVRLIDDKNKELCKYNLTENYDVSGMIMCSIYIKKNGCWAMTANGVGCQGRRATDCINDAKDVASQNDRCPIDKLPPFNAPPEPPVSDYMNDDQSCHCVLL